MTRLSTGIPELDGLLDGGLIPGTLTMVLGATGIGKTQLGLQFANAGMSQEGHRGILFDMASRGDAQNHEQYAQRMFDWQLSTQQGQVAVNLDMIFSTKRTAIDYLHVFDEQGKRVTRRDMEFEAWQDWQSHVTKKLATTIAFFYVNFIRGIRRAVIDGIEPVGRPSESIQFELFEYIYHQVLRKEADWVARDLFRQAYRANAEAVTQHMYDPRDIGCMLLHTSQESMLDDLISRPLNEGDLLSNANTLIYMGRVRQGKRLLRAIYIAKHRGSPCGDSIYTYEITNQGLRIEV